MAWNLHKIQRRKKEEKSMMTRAEKIIYAIALVLMILRTDWW